MLQKYKDKREEGFTIIEVLIVLAIAGLIILIVFLAVPALQRNSRNTQRNNDASLIASAVNECLNNKNGQIDSCDSYTDDIQGVFLDETKIRQLTTIGVSTDFPSDGQLTNANIAFGRRCNPSADGVEPGTTRQFAVLYRIETTTGSAGTPKCVDA